MDELGKIISVLSAYKNHSFGDKAEKVTVDDIIALLKAQEPRLITEADFENADEYGFIPVWCEETNKNCYWNCIPRSALETAKEDRCRYWTAKPSLKQMEETPWE